MLVRRLRRSAKMAHALPMGLAVEADLPIDRIGVRTF